ncbi:hypothetical protein ACHAXR_007554 [Thalassiosira sp. AJA248-18]
MSLFRWIILCIIGYSSSSSSAFTTRAFQCGLLNEGWSFLGAPRRGPLLPHSLCIPKNSLSPPPSGCDTGSPHYFLQSNKQKPNARLRPLHAFAQRGSDDDYDDDDDDDDDEPPTISTSPQEFLYRMQQKEKQNNNGDNNDGDITTTPAAYNGPGGRGGRSSAPQKIRPTFGKKTPSSNNINSKDSTVYVCTNCGSEYVQWRGRCGTCLEWNTIQEYRAKKRKPSLSSSTGSGGISSKGGNNMRAPTNSKKTGSSWLDGISGDYYYGGSVGSDAGGPVRVTDVYQEILNDSDNLGDGSSSWEEAYRKGSMREQRTKVPDDPELNAVLGGGLMPGSISLVGGDPGVGKSTLLLQMAGSVASMAERSLQFQGIGMGPSKPSQTTTTPLSESEEESNNIQKPKRQQQQAQQNGGPVLYISGEENSNQIASRALRLGIQDPELLLWCETDADIIADTVADTMYGGPTFNDQSFEESAVDKSNSPPLSKPPSLVVIDSIQTMLCDAAGSSAAGGITQVRECVGLFLRLAKSTGVPIMLVGHVTKSGDVAGPRTVEHMVDCVLYLEGGLMGAGGTAGTGGAESSSGGGGVSSLRVLRAAKNRFGSSDEVGVYEMSRGGRLLPISDPSSFFLSTRLDNADAEGCAISVVLEGIRSMTVEVQALVAYSAGSGGYSGRRIVDGISNSRLLLILAVLQKRYGISFHRRDVYVNVVGGMHLGKGSKSGGGSDLAVAVAVVSSLVGIPVRSDTAFVGEVGLLGELRPVHSLEKRISEARRMGFSRIVTPSSSSKKKKREGRNSSAPGPKEVSAGGIKQLMCDNVLDAINCGLVMKLPTKQTRSGPKLIKPKRATNKGNTNGREKSFDMDELDIILDDENDDIYD